MVICFQTRAEALAGATSRGWGSPRMDALRERLDQTPTIGVDLDVIDCWARLTAEARASGHGLGGKEHSADRWIAASAIAKDLPLLSRDGIFGGAPGLQLLV